MKESFAKSRYDHLLFTFVFVFVSLAKRHSLENFSGPWHAITMDLQTSEQKQATLLMMRGGFES
jgi:hypothetical protein